jgi:tetratricopeptide (TPR) repeat protein
LVSESRDAEAITFLRSSITELERIYGTTHPLVGDAWNLLGIAFGDSGEYEACSAAFQKSADIEHLQAPQGSLRQLVRYANLGSAYRDAGHPEAAIAALDKSIEFAHRYSKPNDPTLLAIYYEKAAALRELGRLNDAQAVIELTDPILATQTVDRDRVAGFVGIERGRIFFAEHRYAAAEQQLRSSLATIAPEEPRIQANAHLALGEVLVATKRCDDGISELRAAYELRRGVMPKQNWFIYEAESALGDGLSQCGHLTEAQPLLDESVRELRHLRSANDAKLAQAIGALARHNERSALAAAKNSRA